ncbi:MAG: aminotransferase class V-fold PLP-dependent enzyme, partial [Verrucomicrobiota bacterium]
MNKVSKQLAIHGGKPAAGDMTSKNPDYGLKTGANEFLALAEAFGYSASALEEIRRIAEREDSGIDPMMMRYYARDVSRVDAFEAFSRELFGAEHALAVNSGTSALIAALAGAEIGPGDEVIVPGYTFLASAAAVLAVGATPVVADIDDTLMLDPAAAESWITPKTRAIMPVHMQGGCADMDGISALARRHGLKVIEDNAQSCGGRYRGRWLGTLGDAGCFSFSSVKIVGCGEGGLVLSDDAWLMTRARSQHDTAGCWREDRYAEALQPGELFGGENYRMSELEGAVNLAQLRRMPEQAERYRKTSRAVMEALPEFSATRVRPSNDPEGDIGHILFLMAESGSVATDIAEALGAEGLDASARGDSDRRDWHLYTYWDHLLPPESISVDRCPNVLDLTRRAIRIRIHQGWTENDCE